MKTRPYRENSAREETINIERLLKQIKRIKTTFKNRFIAIILSAAFAMHYGYTKMADNVSGKLLVTGCIVMLHTFAVKRNSGVS